MTGLEKRRTGLEKRYRRLLRVYPAGHRADYEEEMIAVLMSGAGPARRFPASADAVDLLRAGLAARWGRALHTQRGTGWRDAAAVVALLASVVMAGAAFERLVDGLIQWTHSPMRAYGIDGLLVAEPLVRTVTWVLVVVVAVLGLRRFAVLAAAAGVLAQVGTVTFWTGLDSWQALRLSWTVALALVTLVLFAVAAIGRSVRAVLGRGGSLLVAGALTWSALFHAMLYAGPLDVPVEVGLRLLQALPVAVLAAAMIGAGPRVRGRIAVLGAVVVMIPVAFNVLEVLAQWAYIIGLSSAVVTGAVVVLALTPVMIFGTGWGVLGVSERFAARRAGHLRAHE